MMAKESLTQVTDLMNSVGIDHMEENWIPEHSWEQQTP